MCCEPRLKQNENWSLMADRVWLTLILLFFVVYNLSIAYFVFQINIKNKLAGLENWRHFNKDVNGPVAKQPRKAFIHCSPHFVS